MLLVVKDSGINAAKTPEGALKHISAMRPFIELPDLALDPKEKLDGVQLTAINVAARLGVVGPEVALEPSADTVRRLAEMKIIATDGSGASLAENTGAATLGNPLNVAVWLIEELKKGGHELKAGDLISVGTFWSKPLRQSGDNALVERPIVLSDEPPDFPRDLSYSSLSLSLVRHPSPPPTLSRPSNSVKRSRHACIV